MTPMSHTTLISGFSGSSVGAAGLKLVELTPRLESLMGSKRARRAQPTARCESERQRRVGTPRPTGRESTVSPHVFGNGYKNKPGSLFGLSESLVGAAGPADRMLRERPAGPAGPTHSGAFSLVEVVIALGIVSFALLAIFALFGSSLRSASETISQQEVLGITRSLGEYLGSTNTNNGIVGYAAVSNWVGSSDPGIFAFVSNNGAVTIGLSNAIATTADTITNRAGRLYRIVPTLSTNVPGITSASDLATNAFIPLQVKIYEVPTVGASTNNLMPVFTYETSVFR